MVEQLPFKQLVDGSSPSGRTNLQRQVVGQRAGAGQEEREAHDYKEEERRALERDKCGVAVFDDEAFGEHNEPQNGRDLRVVAEDKHPADEHVERARQRDDAPARADEREGYLFYLVAALGVRVCDVQKHNAGSGADERRREKRKYEQIGEGVKHIIAG